MPGLTEGRGPADQQLMGPGGHPSLTMRSPPQSHSSELWPPKPQSQGGKPRLVYSGEVAVCRLLPTAAPSRDVQAWSQLGFMPSFLGVPSGSHR